MFTPSRPSRRRALLVCAFAVVTALMCGGLMSAAALVPAPPAVLPFLVAVGIGGPMAATVPLRDAIVTLRRGGRRLDGNAVHTMRQEIAALPETDHPLGL